MNKLTDSLSAICTDERLTEKWIIAPTRRVGQMWLDELARQRRPVLNARVQTMRGLTLNFAAPQIAKRSSRLIGKFEAQILIEEIWEQCASSTVKDQEKYLFSLRPSGKLFERLLQTLQELRLAQISPDDLLQKLAGESSSKAQELSCLLQKYEEQLAAGERWDWASALHYALAQIQKNELGDCLYLAAPSEFRFDWEHQLWQALPWKKRRELVTDCALNISAQTSFFAAKGEANEVREVLRRIGAKKIPFDQVELLHTDRQTYLPLVFETFFADLPDEQAELPVTFEEGIEIRYARPARALSAWLDWVSDNYRQSTLARMIQDGLLNFPSSPELMPQPSFAHRAALLLEIAIGQGQERYLPALDREIRATMFRANQPADPDHLEAEANKQAALKQRLGLLRELSETISILLNHSGNFVTPCEVLSSALFFVENQARALNKLDHYAKRLLRRELQTMIAIGDAEKIPGNLDVWSWLRSLVSEKRIGGEGPRPGCLYVSSLDNGGHSNRPHTFILGLDDSRFLGGVSQDPLLLDNERVKLSPWLSIGPKRAELKKKKWAQLISRMRKQVTFSFSILDLATGADLFPSPLLLDLYRKASGQEKSTLAEFIKDLPPVASYVGDSSASCLTAGEWWLQAVCQQVKNGAQGLSRVLEEYANLRRGLGAAVQRQSDFFTSYDGWVPAAGLARDPTNPSGPVLSASQLELFAKSPFDYFCKYILQIEPSTEEEELWPGALARGSVIHETLCDFMRTLQTQKLLPVQLQRDLALLQQMFKKRLDRLVEEFPPPDEQTLAKELRFLHETAFVFLTNEIARGLQFTPYAFEVAVGKNNSGEPTALDRKEPLALDLGAVGTIRLRGSIDRLDVDFTQGHPLVEVWDYKSSRSTKSYEAGPFNEGRLIQSYIYQQFCEAVLKQIAGQEVKFSRFGYYFPTPFLMGERISWSAEELQEGKQIVSAIVNMIKQGYFPCSTNADDLKFSDYLECLLTDEKTAADCASRKILSSDAERKFPFDGLRKNADDKKTKSNLRRK